MNKDKKVQKHLYFSEAQIELINAKALSLGMSANEWLKFTILKRLEYGVNEGKVVSNEASSDSKDDFENLINSYRNKGLTFIERRDLENAAFFAELNSKNNSKINDDANTNKLA